MKPIFSKDHAEVIGALWNGLGDEAKASIYNSVAIALTGKVPEHGEVIDASFSDAVRVSWCLGFHYAMCAMEQGALVKVGTVNKEN